MSLLGILRLSSAIFTAIHSEYDSSAGLTWQRPELLAELR